jgi:hypothetical protein
LALLAALAGGLVGTGAGFAEQVFASSDEPPSFQTQADDPVPPPHIPPPRVGHVLDVLDRDHKGYVTINDLAAWLDRRPAENR